VELRDSYVSCSSAYSAVQLAVKLVVKRRDITARRQDGRLRAPSAAARSGGAAAAPPWRALRVGAGPCSTHARELALLTALQMIYY
jgi:hypothetical protein